MRIEMIEIEKLLPADYNPRLDLQPEDEEYQKIQTSIETFGLVDPVIWNERTGHVVGGHQRLKVLKGMGYQELQVSVVDLSKEEEMALNVALNKIGGDWDEPKLKDLLQELALSDLDETLTGFSSSEIEGLIEEINIEDFFEDSEPSHEEDEQDDFEQEDVERLDVAMNLLGRVLDETNVEGDLLEAIKYFLGEA